MVHFSLVFKRMRQEGAFCHKMSYLDVFYPFDVSKTLYLKTNSDKIKMMAKGKNIVNDIDEERLEGWKQISSYLDKSIRSLQRKEKKFGLPIRREEDTPKSRVYALKNELHKWRDAKATPPVQQTHQVKQRLEPIYYYILAITAISILVAVFFAFRTQSSSQPSDFRIVGSELVILDENKTQLWRFETHIENLASEEEYKEHFQVKSQLHDGKFGTRQPMLIIKDLDQDGRNEVLFATYRKGHRPPAEVILFNWKGKDLWRQKVGKEMKYGKSLFSDFYVNGVFTPDLDNDGIAEIVININHFNLFPSSLLILDLKKEVIGEYWNSGRLRDYIFTDLNKDGRKEIIIGGQNNEYNKGCVIVFDSSEVFGGSPQQAPYYKCNSLKKGSEKYYLLFPRTEFEVDFRGFCFNVLRLENERVRAVLGETGLIYEFDPLFKIQDILTSNIFDSMHEKALKGNDFNRESKKAYLENLASEIQYFNGNEWTSQPALSNDW